MLGRESARGCRLQTEIREEERTPYGGYSLATLPAGIGPLFFCSRAGQQRLDRCKTRYFSPTTFGVAAPSGNHADCDTYLRADDGRILIISTGFNGHRRRAGRLPALSHPQEQPQNLLPAWLRGSRRLREVWCRRRSQAPRCECPAESFRGRLQ